MHCTVSIKLTLVSETFSTDVIRQTFAAVTSHMSLVCCLIVECLGTGVTVHNFMFFVVVLCE